MFRTAFISIFVFSFLAGAPVRSQHQDYTDQLMKLTELTDSKRYRDAINGYKRLQAQPGTPEWLSAASEYEIAELYAALNETDNAIAALSRAVQLGFDDCITPRSSERLAAIIQRTGRKKKENLRVSGDCNSRDAEVSFETGPA